MKIAVFSDTHGAGELMLSCAQKLSPDAIIHLGDCVRDTLPVKKEMPHTTFIGVRGNCDAYSDLSEREICEFEGHRLFICHGHRYSVKMGTDALLTTAMCSDSDVVLYGHTHKPDLRADSGMLILNPGSLGRGTESTFAVLELERNLPPRARIITPREL